MSPQPLASVSPAIGALPSQNWAATAHTGPCTGRLGASPARHPPFLWLACTASCRRLAPPTVASTSTSSPPSHR
eukprot:252028-Prymnesium_polylepis.1